MFCIESLHAVGVGILVFRIMPDLDAVTGEFDTDSLKPETLKMILIF